MHNKISSSNGSSNSSNSSNNSLNNLLEDGETIIMFNLNNKTRFMYSLDNKREDLKVSAASLAPACSAVASQVDVHHHYVSHPQQGMTAASNSQCFVRLN